MCNARILEKKTNYVKVSGKRIPLILLVRLRPMNKPERDRFILSKGLFYVLVLDEVYGIPIERRDILMDGG